MNDSGWSVEFLDAAFRQLERLGPPVTDRITSKLAWLADHAADVDHVPLHGELAGFYKLRVGDWRVIYEVDPARRTLVVHAVKHRREAYRD
jgi:mRNA interferase RelE/StbE